MLSPRGPTACFFPLLLAAAAAQAEPDDLPRAEGYRGLWYSNQPTKDEHRFKYSGGLSTYPQQHLPIAFHSEQAGKTFFVYGGVSEEGSLLHMVSCFDHGTGEVPRPVVLLDKETTDAHDNPVLMLDDVGHLWVFSNSHGTARPSYVHRSKRPLSIDDGFERVLETNFSYGQPWFVPGHGWCFLHTRYGGGRRLYCLRSEDGLEWEEPELLAAVERGHYQVSWRNGDRVGTAFNFHPRDGGLNARTNLYYMESADGGTTWRNARGNALELPLTEWKNPALVHDYRAEEKLVYLKDVQFDRSGNPVILYLTSGGWQPGPESGPRVWWTARWTGEQWERREVTRSDHNYDFGSLYVESNGLWRLIAPTDPGPQPFGTGGEMVSWTSEDQGATWRRARTLTRDSPFNHTYARRPVNAHPDFYALWADGNPHQRSESRLYFTNREGTVRVLPERMTMKRTKPEEVR